MSTQHTAACTTAMNEERPFFFCRYIDIVAGLAVTNQGHIVAVDSVSPTVFIISEDGDLVHWFDCSDYMREPSDIAISGKWFIL